MSIRVMSAVWEDSKQKGNGLLLLLALADFADDAGKCYPSVDRLAFKTRMSRRNIQTLARQLVADGEITITENAGRNGCNVYQIIGVQSLHPCKPAPESGNNGGAKPGPEIAPDPSGTITVEPSGTSSAAGASAPCGKGAEAKVRHNEFVDLWFESYQVQFGKAYVFQSKDWKPLKSLLSALKCPVGEIMKVATRAWAKAHDKRNFFECHRAAHSLQAFCSNFSAVVAELEQRRPGDIPARPALPNGQDDHEARHGVPRGTIPFSQQPPPGEDESGNKISMDEWRKRFPLTLYDHDK